MYIETKVVLQFICDGFSFTGILMLSFIWSAGSFYMVGLRCRVRMLGGGV
jgi:hypothetical protein